VRKVPGDHLPWPLPEGDEATCGGEGVAFRFAPRELLVLHHYDPAG
jgi:hypothetical protein